MARDYPLAAFALRSNKQARLIVTRHVLFPMNRLHRITLSRASRVIAVSEAVASQLRTDRVVAPDRISVVLNGIDTSRFAASSPTPAREEFLSNWKLPSNSLLVGTVGELSPLKGQGEVLQAAVQVLAHRPNAYFIIAGVDHSKDNKNRVALERSIEQLNLKDRVRLVGWLGDLAQFYKVLDVFVSASHAESFGLAIVEAMASGVAVVATKTEGAREIIQDGETGTLVPIGDSDKLAKTILELLGNKDRRARMGGMAQESVGKRFSVERMIAETEEIYRAEVGEITK
jgi:glycosyltransferase involved in cell wall biosynthesis